MSNVKKVLLSGRLPFNIYEFDECCKLLGQLNAPVSGLRITYGELAASVPNEYGGTTAFIEFCISGEEAVSLSWITRLIQEFSRYGTVFTRKEVVDIENNEVLLKEIV